MKRTHWRAAPLALLVLASACDSTPADLFVEVRTDLAPGTDFDQVVTELYADETRDPEQTRTRNVGPADDFVAGARVAEMMNVPLGSYTLRVTLLLAGTELQSQRLFIQLEGPRVEIFEFDGSCNGVICPGTSDPPEATMCSQGRCVDPNMGPDAGVDGGQDDAAVNDAGPGGALAFAPDTYSMNVGSRRTITATGGSAPVVYSVVSGNGSIDATTGEVMTFNYGETMVIRATDAANDTADATITVGGSHIFTVGGWGGSTSEFVYQSADGAAWTGNTMPQSRGETVSVVFEDAIYVLGGWRSGNLDEVLTSPTGATGSWTTAGYLVAPRGWGGAVVHDGRIIYAGGRSPSDTRNTDVYASSDGVGWMKIGDLPTATTWGGLATFEDALFYLGGNRASGPANSIWVSNDGATWQVAPETLPAARAGGAVLVHLNRLWYIGGEDGSGSPADDVWGSPDGLAWSSVGRIPQAFYNAAATVHAGELWIIGGNASGYRQTAYHSADGVTWSRATNIPESLDRFSCVSFTPTP